jgi:hypothetical protein
MMLRQLPNRKRVLKGDWERTESLAFEFARQDLGEGFPRFKTAQCSLDADFPNGGGAYCGG